MAENHSVAMFIQQDGEKVQVGWASPAVEGVRTFEFSPGFSGDNRPTLKNVSFEDDALSQEVAAEQEEHPEDFEVTVEPAEEPVEEPVTAPEETGQTAPETADTTDDYPQAGDEGKDSAPLVIEPNEELAAQPVQGAAADTEPTEVVEGGDITEVNETPAVKPAHPPQSRRNNQNRNKGGNPNNQRKNN